MIGISSNSERLYRSLDPRKHEFRILTILLSKDHIPAVPPSQLRGDDNNSSINAVDIYYIL